MKILYVGDVMGQAGRETLAKVLPTIKMQHAVELVIVQAENSHDNGKSPSASDVAAMQAAGADFFTGGNHSFANKETNVLYDDPDAPLIRPANVEDVHGAGYKIIDCAGKRLLVCSLLGQIVGGQKYKVANPLTAVDDILGKQYGNFDVAVVNFHGDFSSEKVVIGHYLDGRVAAVIGDHWHVPTADAMILPKGTAHITDVGMVGALHSSLGIKSEVIIERWKSNSQSKNEMELAGPFQFNAVLIEIDPATNLSTSITHLHQVIE